jgi:hypothetical protein
MLAKRFLTVAALSLPLACSSQSDDDAASSGNAGRPMQASGGASDLGGNGGVAAAAGAAVASGMGGAAAGNGAAGSANLGGMSATSGTGGAGDDALIVPTSVQVSALPGGTGSLDLIALTIRQGPTNAELYAALKNDGDMYACDAGLTINLYDTDQQPITGGIGALLTQHVYQRTDGSGTLAACAGPGDVVMAAITDLPSPVTVSDVGYAVYHCTYFVLDVVPVAGFSVNQVQTVKVVAGTAYTGALVNGLDVVVNNPAVTIFPLNSVGRPLGAATATGTSTDLIPAGSSWPFETGLVDTPGVSYAAYGSAAPAPAN